MPDPLVTLMRTRYVRGWPRHEHGEFVYRVPLSRVMARSFASDAHFTAYTSYVDRRLTREALDEGVTVELTAIAFDIDCSDVHGTAAKAPDDWRADEWEKLHRLDDAHPGLFAYDTRGGMRAVYVRREPTIIRTHNDGREWRRHYAVACQYLRRRFGIEADPACGDWQRCFRAPHATREGNRHPERRPTYGDPHAIGVLEIEATREDVEEARRACKAFDCARHVELKPGGGGHGLLYHLLRNRGDIGRAHAGGHVVRCPNEAQHTTGRTGDGSTVLYPPASGEEIGALCCLHAHCQHLRARDWLAMFTEDELARARADAGITRAA